MLHRYYCANGASLHFPPTVSRNTRADLRARAVNAITRLAEAASIVGARAALIAVIPRDYARWRPDPE